MEYIIVAVSSSYGGAGKDVVVGVVTPPEDEEVVTFVAPAIKCRSSKEDNTKKAE